MSHDARRTEIAAKGLAAIRPAKPKDLAAIWELMRGLAVYEKLEEHFTGTPELLAAHLFGDASPRLESLVAEANGRLVGYAIVYQVFSTFWTKPMMWLEDLFVDPSHRGAGTGRELLRAVARLAVAKGCKRLDWAVLDWNEPAIGFYEKQGAVRAGGWHTYRFEPGALEAFADIPPGA